MSVRPLMVKDGIQDGVAYGILIRMLWLLGAPKGSNPAAGTSGQRSLVIPELKKQEGTPLYLSDEVLVKWFLEYNLQHRHVCMNSFCSHMYICLGLLKTILNNMIIIRYIFIDECLCFCCLCYMSV